jgi:hypothetical protein
MNRLFLLRAFGDFTIALNAILKSKKKEQFKIVASLHLTPLYLAISKVTDLSSIDIEFVDFDVHHSQLNIFTNRHLLDTDTFSQIKKIKQYLAINSSEGGVDFIEQQKRRTLLELLLNHRFKPIVVERNVYEQYERFFATTPTTNSESSPTSISTRIPAGGTILVLPDARIEKRHIPQSIIDSIKIKAAAKGYQVEVAYFKQQITGATMYKNFVELIQLIQNASMVIGADSLPIHLSNFLGKAHFILYPTGGSKGFFTPFTMQHNYYSEFEPFQIKFLEASNG